MKCPVCEAEISEFSLCPTCSFDPGRDYESHPSLTPLEGAKPLSVLRADWQRKDRDLLRCPGCGGLDFRFDQRKHELFCSSCGLRLPFRADPETGETPRPGEDPAPGPVSHRGNVPGQGWVCICGYRNSAESRYCANCDRPAGRVSLAQPVSGSGRGKTVLQPGEWVCSCGTRNRPGSRFCAGCDSPRR